MSIAIIMIQVGELINAVQHNCHISDAQHAGDYTLCLFLLKMREFYRWEHQLPVGHPLPKKEVGEWMAAREQLWEEIEASNFDKLQLENETLDPFEAETINQALIPQGLIYGGGYGRYHKPYFFLGALSRAETREGCNILVSSCEYARELTAPPAMSQNRTIYLRLESVRRFLWEKIEESHWNNGQDAMTRALEAYGFGALPDPRGATKPERATSDAFERALDQMTEAEGQAMILHELGEVRAGMLLGETWHELLTALSRSPAEIMARAVRDILADSLCTLPTLIADENWPSMHFYFANFTGMRKHLYPELPESYRAAVEQNSFSPLAARVDQDAPRWLTTAQNLLSLHRSGRDDLERAIEHLLVTEDAETRCRSR